jgi:hypothetical protein
MCTLYYEAVIQLMIGFNTDGNGNSLVDMGFFRCAISVCVNLRRSSFPTNFTCDSTENRTQVGTCISACFVFFSMLGVIYYRMFFCEGKEGY